MTLCLVLSPGAAVSHPEHDNRPLSAARFCLHASLTAGELTFVYASQLVESEAAVTVSPHLLKADKTSTINKQVYGLLFKHILYVYSMMLKPDEFLILTLCYHPCCLFVSSLD